MLTKEQFISAMTFFDKYEEIQNNAVATVNQFFESNGLIFTGCDDLYNKYLDLLKLAMNIDLNDENDPISFYLYESVEDMEKYQNSIYGIMDAMNTDYKNLDLDIEKLQGDISNPENLTLLKDIMTRLG